MITRPKVLGDLRAEADHAMLDRAFYETLDFKTLVETSDRPLVVGRRGTGKSALLYRLAQHWAGTSTKVISISPEEDQIIGLRPLVSQFGGEFRRIRAGSRIAWRYALMLEFADHLLRHYKFPHDDAGALLKRHCDAWRNAGPSCTSRLRAILRRHLIAPTVEERIATLAQALEVDDVGAALRNALTRTGLSAVLLVDRLDEGYEPDDPGVGLVAGILQATIDLKTWHAERVRVALFLRDNIFRTIARQDPDYSRNVEGQVLRLHWDEQQLFNMVCNRLRVAFALDVESNRRVWEACTAPDLHGFEGFRQCLRLTLYRPRDLLSLLNEAYYVAARENAAQITLAHVEKTAKEISVTRLDDLNKEYSAVIPALERFTSAFANGSAELNLADTLALLRDVMTSDSFEPPVQQDIAIHEDIESIARTLYGVGFLGVHDPSAQGFVFCHDGTTSTVDFKDDTRLLVHPCYWMSLNLGIPVTASEGTQQINDEYEIQVTSKAPEVRRARIGAMLARLGQIPQGVPGQTQFEDWALKAVQIAFGGHLRSIELHPNGSAVQRRDVVGTNLGQSPNWQRIREDYDTRQVIFEIKNYEGIRRDDYRQILSYLTVEYGRLAFLICRDQDIEPKKGAELDWIRELYQGHKVLAVKLTARWLSKLLGRLRSPERHDAADVQLGSLLDNYQRLYIGGQVATRRRKKRGRSGR